jgi:hypothetical protein
MRQQRRGLHVAAVMQQAWGQVQREHRLPLGGLQALCLQCTSWLGLVAAVRVHGGALEGGSVALKCGRLLHGYNNSTGFAACCRHMQELSTLCWCEAQLRSRVVGRVASLPGPQQQSCCVGVCGELRLPQVWKHTWSWLLRQ